MADQERDTTGMDTGSAVERAPGEATLRAMYDSAEREIAEWLAEADQERALIVERARSEAAQISADARHEADALRHDALELIAAARAKHSRIVEEGEAAVAALRANAVELTSSTLLAAEREAAQIRTLAEAEARMTRSRLRVEILEIHVRLERLGSGLTQMLRAGGDLLPSLQTTADILAQLTEDTPPLGTPVEGPEGSPAEGAPEELQGQQDAGRTRGIGAISRGAPGRPGGPGTGGAAETGTADSQPGDDRPPQRRGLGRLLRPGRLDGATTSRPPTPTG